MKKLLCFGLVFILIAAPTIAFLQTYDPLVEKQWYLEKINVFDAWEEYTQGSEEVIVAVIDTGVDITHPDLSGNIWVNMDEWYGDDIDNDNNGYIDDINGYDFVYDYYEPTPELTFDFDEVFVHHGTFISGIIAAVQNGKGITGVAPNVKIMPLKVLDEYGYGESDTVEEAIHYAIDNGADIINMSLAGYNDTAGMTRAIERANENNVIIVAASGNGDYFGYSFDLEYTSVFPICYDQDTPNMLVIGVGSTGEEDLPSEFSNFGVECLDVSAPGEQMFSTKIHQLAEFESDYYGNESEGTSYSAAVVSGVIALMRSLNRSVTIEDVMAAFEDESVDIELPFYMEEGDMGVGRLDAYNSLGSILLKLGISTSKSPWNVLISQASKGAPNFLILNKNLEVEEEIAVFAKDFSDGLVIESADINNDEILEYIVAPVAGTPAMLRILTRDQILLASRYIFEKEFTGGINLSSIMISDGSNNILACSGPGRQTELMILDQRLEQTGILMPFNDKYGCTVSAGDVNNDGEEEIVVGSLKDPVVKIYTQDGELLNSFIAYEKGIEGVYMDVADMNDNGFAEIITGPYKGAPLVKIFDQDGKASVSFMAYDPAFKGGVKPKATDYNGQANLDIITVPAYDGGPHLRIFDILGNVLFEKFIYSKDFTGGMNIASTN